MAENFNFSDVFISYSRRDRLFVQKIDQILRRQGLEVWVDWEDIPLTGAWWAEIQAGIESANSFIFVISPESAQSDVCRNEIEHAVAQHKRIIPILYREVLGQEVQQKLHPAISAHNWLYIREEDNLEAAAGNLILAIQTDVAHVREHTRLTVRAADWVSRNRDNSLLLSGAGLNEALTWLQDSANKEPRPTDQIIAYIQTSSRRQGTQQRRLLFGFALILILFISLAALSAYTLTSTQTNDTGSTMIAIAATNVAFSEALDATRIQLELTQTQIAVAEQSTSQSLSNAELTATARNFESPTPISTFVALAGTATGVSLNLADANLQLTEAAIRIDTLQSITLAEPSDSPIDTVQEVLTLQLATQLITLLAITLLGLLGYIVWQRRSQFTRRGIVQALDLSDINEDTIFISYSRRDYEEFVAPLVVKLRDRGYSVWIDQGKLQAGDRWLDEIEEALDACGRLILCLSPQALESDYVKLEYQSFLFQKPLIPIMCRQTELPKHLQRIQYTEYEKFEELCATLDQYKPKRANSQ